MTTQNQIEKTNIASSGANSDITSMSGLTGAISAPTFINDSSGNHLLQLDYLGSAVNYLLISNNATGLPPVINSEGSNTNIDLNIGGKGTGAVNILGASTNSTAASGYVGEVISSTVLQASAVTLTSTVNSDVTSISLTAGDWDVYGNVTMFPTSGGMDYGIAWISTTSATAPDSALYSGPIQATAVYTEIGVTTPCVPLQLASTTTVYLSCQSQFGVTAKACGRIFARRVR
jgi:hypothetical protein